jgi:hypothetical protein
MSRSMQGYAATITVASVLLANRIECAARDIADYTELDPAKHGIEQIDPKKDPKTGFILGGVNETALLLKLSELAGRPIEDLERDMRPGATAKGGSDAGFLGKDENLLKVLAMDNKYVVDEQRLTHQELARHLHAVGIIAAESAGQEFLYHGRRFQAQYFPTRGYQFSPFNDGTKTNAEALVENIETGKQIKFSLLLPYMIERYGFYEGAGTSYRVDPAKVLEVLDFLKPDTLKSSK